MSVPVRITQTYQAIRTIVIQVPDTDDPEDAYEQVQSGSVDIPDFDNPSWETGWSLLLESYETL